MERDINQVISVANVVLECNQAVFDAKTEEDYYETICQLMVDSGGFSVAMVLMIDKVYDYSLNLAAFKTEDIIFDSIAGEILSEKDFWGSEIGRNLELRGSYINNSIIDQPGAPCCLLTAVNAGCQSTVAFPVKYGNEVCGFMMLFSTDKDRFDSDAVSLLINFSESISKGVVAIRTRCQTDKILNILSENANLHKEIESFSNEIFYKYRYETQMYDYISSAVKRLTGYDPEEINSDLAHELLRDIKKIEQSSRRTIGGLSVQQKEKMMDVFANFIIKTKSGENKWFEDHSYPWLNDKGEQIGIIGLLKDITEKKKAEQELENASEITNELKKLKENILANLSHELITPMTIILGYAEILKKDLKDESLREMAMEIYQTGSRMVDTLNLLLDLAKLESENVNFDLSPVDVIRLIDETISSFSIEVLQKKIFLKKMTPDKSIIFNTNERMLKNVLNNIINNAVKFTLTGGVTVIVEVEGEGKNRNLVLKIADTGIGITETEKEYIWDDFRQGSEGLNRKFGGLGLGLSISKRFVEYLGGTIYAYKNKDIGTTVAIRLPEYEADTIVVNRILKKVELQKNIEEKYKRRTPRALIVDDDESSRFVLSIFLSGTFEYDEANNAKDAIILACKKQYDIIFMDINLGKGKTGLEAALQIKQFEEYKTTPIVAISAFSLKGDIEEVFSSGCTHYISKPFQKNEFTNFVRKICKLEENNKIW